MAWIAVIWTEAVEAALPRECVRRLEEGGVRVLQLVADPLRRAHEFLRFLDQAKAHKALAILCIEMHVPRCAPMAAGHSDVPVIALLADGKPFSANGAGGENEPDYAVVHPATAVGAVNYLLRLIQAKEASSNNAAPEGPSSQNLIMRHSGSERESSKRPPRITTDVNSPDTEWVEKLAKDFRPKLRTTPVRPVGRAEQRPLEYSRELQAVVTAAREIAAAYGNEFVSTLHYLAAIMDTPHCLGREAMRCAAVDFESLAERIVASFPSFPPSSEKSSGTFVPDVGATAMVSMARKIARRRGRKLLTTADFLEAIVSQSESRAAELLREIGFTDAVLSDTLEHAELPDETLPEALSELERTPERIVELNPEEVQRLEARLFPHRRSSCTESSGQSPLPGPSVVGDLETSAIRATRDDVPTPGGLSLSREPEYRSKDIVMTPMILKCDPDNPPLEVVEQAADFLLEGKTVCFPTDTVYGVGVDATNRDAVERLYALKGRIREKPIAVLIHSATLLRNIVQEIPLEIEPVIERFWPGPLTIVFRRRPHNFEAISSDHTIGLRIPNHYVTLAILSMVGRPLATSSANISGELNAVDPHDALAQLGSRLDMLVDAGRAPGGAASTVLSVAEKPYRILRPGPVSRDELEALMGCKVLDP